MDIVVAEVDTEAVEEGFIAVETNNTDLNNNNISLNPRQRLLLIQIKKMLKQLQEKNQSSIQMLLLLSLLDLTSHRNQQLQARPVQYFHLSASNISQNQS